MLVCRWKKPCRQPFRVAPSDASAFSSAPDIAGLTCKIAWVVWDCLSVPGDVRLRFLLARFSAGHSRVMDFCWKKPRGQSCGQPCRVAPCDASAFSSAPNIARYKGDEAQEGERNHAPKQNVAKGVAIVSKLLAEPIIQPVATIDVMQQRSLAGSPDYNLCR